MVFAPRIGNVSTEFAVLRINNLHNAVLSLSKNIPHLLFSSRWMQFKVKKEEIVFV